MTALSKLTVSKLQPFQRELLKRLESMSYKAKKRFQLVPQVMQSGFVRDELGLHGLMIEDYVWWMDNERAILNWMVDNLPHGIEHQQGMMVYLPTENDRIMFLLKWGG